jgi:hypothetical protein
MSLPTEKVWVEAERTQPGIAILTLGDVRKRRALMEKRGRHNVTLPFSEMEALGFPPKFLEDLEHGRPIRFKMFEIAYESLLFGSSEVGKDFLEGLEGPAHYHRIRFPDGTKGRTEKDFLEGLGESMPDEVRQVAEAMAANAVAGEFDADRAYASFTEAGKYGPAQWTIGDNYEQHSLWLVYTDGVWSYRDQYRDPEEWPMRGGFKEAMANAQIFFTG